MTLPAILERPSIGAPSLFVRIHESNAHVSTAIGDVAEPTSKPDVERLAALVCQLPPLDPSATAFRDVRRIPPGTRLHVDASGAMQAKLSAPPLPSVGNGDPLSLAGRLWSTIERAVDSRIGESRHVVVLTGGGVDSSALLAATLRVSRRKNVRVDALALDFGGEGDDRPHLAALERSLGIRAVRVDPTDARSSILPLSSGALPSWSPTTATDRLLLSRAHALGADCVLTGLGGDDLFDGERPQRGLRRILTPLIPLSVIRARRTRSYDAWWPWAGPVLRSFWDAEAAQFEERDTSTPAGRHAAIARATYILDSIELSDAVAAEAGVRIEHPFLADEVVALVAAMSPRSLLHGGRIRGLFRLAARGHVPDSVRLRPDKASFHQAMVRAFDAAGGPSSLAELRTGAELAKLGLVDAPSFERAVETFETTWRTDESQWGGIWPALAVEAFLRERAKREAP